MLKRLGSLLLSASLVAALLIVVTTNEAHAYIDLGSGSFLIQILLGSLFAFLFGLKLFWQRLTARMSRLLSRLRHSYKP